MNYIHLKNSDNQDVDNTEEEGINGGTPLCTVSYQVLLSYSLLLINWAHVCYQINTSIK